MLKDKVCRKAILFTFIVTLSFFLGCGEKSLVDVPLSEQNELTILTKHSWDGRFLQLIDDTALNCGGNQIGVAEMRPKGAVSQVMVDILNGNPNETRQVFWVCSSGPCHAGCGFVSLGTITTNAEGRGSFRFEGPAPFPGDAHLDVCPGTPSGCSGGNYFSGIFQLSSSVQVKTPENAGVGDPIR